MTLDIKGVSGNTQHEYNNTAIMLSVRFYLLLSQVLLCWVLYGHYDNVWAPDEPSAETKP